MGALLVGHHGWHALLGLLGHLSELQPIYVFVVGLLGGVMVVEGKQTNGQNRPAYVTDVGIWDVAHGPMF